MQTRDSLPLNRLLEDVVVASRSPAGLGGLSSETAMLLSAPGGLAFRPRTLVWLGGATGVLLWLGFFVPFLSWFALVPFCLLVPAQSDRRTIYLAAWAGGLIYFGLGTYWVSYCAPWVWIGWILLTAYLACYFPLFVFLARVCHWRWGIPLLFVVPMVWVALEYLRMYALSGFGWLMLAHNVYTWTRVIQCADFAGVYGVSFVLALANALWVELLTLPLAVKQGGVHKLNPQLSWRIPTVGLVLFLNVGYGQFRTEGVSLEPGPKVAIVQTNVPQDVRNDVDRSEEQFESIWSEGKRAREMPVQLVVFPETSYPFWYGMIEAGLTDFEVAREYQERVTAPGKPLREKPTADMGGQIRLNIKDGDDHTRGMAEFLGKPMLLGTAFWSIELKGGRLTNASVLVMPKEGRVDRYEKVHLVPFGEYIPLGGNIPLIEYLIPYPADFNYDSDAGVGVRSLHADGLHLAPLICFEDTLPELTRAYLREATKEKPVEILVSQSNDGWFNNSIEGWYHLSASVFRCVESRRPMVRSSNTGLSGLVNSQGEVVRLLDIEGKTQGVGGAVAVDVPLDRRDAPYVVWGDWLPQVSWGMILVCLTLSLARQVRRNRSSSKPGIV